MPNTYGQGSTRAWRKTRQTVLERDQHRCQLRYPNICTGLATIADHITNLASTGTPRRDAVDPADCQAVCPECHDEKTRRERRAGQLARGHRTAKHPGIL